MLQSSARVSKRVLTVARHPSCLVKLSVIAAARGASMSTATSTQPDAASGPSTAPVVNGIDYALTPRMRFPKMNSANIRLVHSTNSLATIYAVIRKVERTFGPVGDVFVTRDPELSTQYQKHININFLHDDALADLPVDGIVLNVSVHEVPEDQPGGISLNQLIPFLEPETKQAEEDMNTFNPAKDREKKVSFKLIAQRYTVHSQGSQYLNANPLHRRREVSKNFLKWAGFNPLKKIEPTVDISDGELFGDSSLDNVRMRRALRRHAYFLKAPTPYENYPETEKPLQSVEKEVKKAPVEENVTKLMEEEVEVKEEEKVELPKRIEKKVELMVEEKSRSMPEDSQPDVPFPPSTSRSLDDILASFPTPSSESTSSPESLQIPPTIPPSLSEPPTSEAEFIPPAPRNSNLKDKWTKDRNAQMKEAHARIAEAMGTDLKKKKKKKVVKKVEETDWSKQFILPEPRSPTRKEPENPTLLGKISSFFKMG